MRRTGCLWLLAALGWLATCTLLPAAAPEVKYFYPAGVQRGQSVEVSTGGKVDKSVQFWIDRPGLTVELAEQGHLKITAAGDAAGVYWIRLTNDEGASSLRPFEVGRLPDVPEKEPNNEPQKPQPLDATCVVNGRFDKNGDVDTYSVHVKQGQTLVAAMFGHRPFGSPMDAVLQVTDPRGFVLAQNDDDRGFDPLVTYTAAADGTYLVRGFAFPSEPNSSIRFSGADTFVYRLTVTTGAYLDHALPLAVEKDAAAEVQLFGWNLSDALRTLPIAPRPAGETSSIAHELLANELALPHEPHPARVEAEPNDKPEQAPLLEWPVTVSGRIAQPGDVDHFRIQVKKGQSLAFEVESRTLGYPLDPYLTLLDAAGKTIARADDSKLSADVQHTQRFAADGEYVLALRDLYRHGGLRFVYRLRITETKPDFQLTLKADHFSVAPKKTVEIPVAVERANGFSGEISITAVELPAGVTAQPVTSQSKGPSAKSVKLVLTASDAPASGPLVIAGTAKLSDTEVRRDATATLDGFDTQTPHVWLTGTKK